ncbi:MAG TPA: uracil-DNA glycosylase [Candidatus Mcinerneyibacterium sp.]|nr:uracil-DNA glycosylase [Candidatus Mcinerneyibacterium sp.]
MENEFVYYTKRFLKSRLGTKIASYLKKERSKKKVYPSSKDIFLPIQLVKPDDVKIVIIGQDPYPSNDAMGIAFSSRNEKTPESLKYLFQNLKKHLYYYDENIDIFTSNDLTPWVKRGILLINKHWTTNNQKEGHMNIGWENFTKGIINILNKREKPVIYILMGKEALSLQKDIKGHIITCPHPNIESYRPNEFLKEDFMNPAFNYINDYNLWENKRLFIDLSSCNNEKELFDTIKQKLKINKWPLEKILLNFDNIDEAIGLYKDTYGIYLNQTINLNL